MRLRNALAVQVTLLGMLALTCSPQTMAADGVSDAESPLPAIEAAATMRVPEGFRVTLFAGEPDVMQPIGFCLDDRARLWVAEAYNYPEHGDRPGDRIVILEDSDGDGRMDKRRVFYDGLNYVTGIEVGFGGAWVMSPPNMYFIPDRDGDDVPDGEPQVLLDGFGNHANAHNLANGFAWGPDGWLYGTHGRTNWSMIGKPGTPEDQRARFDGGVYRYHPTEHVWEPYADGTTNPWGIDWNDVGDAFVCNCVNPHLFQVIQGAHYEPWRGRKSSEYAYQRIDTIADHLHFVGMGNVRNGLGSDEEDQAGGGHAHCGTMIYLGDSFPASYRNQLFTNNIHGRRINNDLLRKVGSGYVASHGPDLMRSEDPWFMGVTLAYGPGGEVYASDWSDTGECHSTRNTRKETGRIFRITYLNTRVPRVNLAELSDSKLAEYQFHDNDWYVRHARRILQERAAAGKAMTQVHRTLHQRLSEADTAAKKLRAIWALRVTGGLSQDELANLLDDDDEEVRRWAVTLWCDDRSPAVEVPTQRFAAMARRDPSPRVRLALASALQRIAPADRWPIAEALASRTEDRDDPNLPLMDWYGIEPLIHDDLERFVDLAAEASIPRLRVHAARRIAESDSATEGLESLCKRLSRSEPDVAADLLTGIITGLEGRRRVRMPPAWRVAYEGLQKMDDRNVRELSVRLALTFQDADAIKSLAADAADGAVEPESRRRAIDALVSAGTDGFGVTLLGLLGDAEVRLAALGGLAQYKVEGTDDAIVDLYANFEAAEKQVAVQTLASRKDWALTLLDAVDSERVPRSDITAFHARQIRALGDKTINERIASLWGEVRETAKDRAKQIASLKKWLTSERIKQADLGNGKTLFTKHCGTCHKFFGEGGAVGPDITGAQRSNLDYLLENIVDPSASVAKDYRMHVLALIDGRVITGLIESENADSVAVLTTTDRVVLPLDEIEQRKGSDLSIMPSGLLENLREQEIRDLFGYLQRRQP